MTLSQADRQQLDQLLTQLVEVQLTEAERTELNRLLRLDEEAIQIAAGTLDVDARLRWKYGASTSASIPFTDTQPADTIQPWKWIALLVPASLVAAVLVLTVPFFLLQDQAPVSPRTTIDLNNWRIEVFAGARGEFQEAESLALDEGRLLIDSMGGGKAGSVPLRLETPHGIARATTGLFDVTVDASSTEITILSGSVSFSNDAGEVNAVSGERVISREAGPPSIETSD